MILQLKKFSVLFLVIFAFCASSNEPVDELEGDKQGKLLLERIKLPDGFKISLYAEVPKARSMALGPDGTVYVGSRNGENIHAITDKNGDFVADEVIAIGDELNTPNGVAFKDGDLYVAEINRILRYNNIEENLKNPGEPEVVFDEYPTEGHHGWKYIAFGPDGYLYVPVGAPCNICKKEDPVYASITRLDLDKGEYEVYARGIRNTVGFTWHPETGDLYFTDNGRDLMGDDIPDCELNVATEAGMHFGYPYCHAGEVKDPEFGDQGACEDFIAPIQKMGAHVAPLGLKFIGGDMFPEEYQGNLIVALHGSWNRSKKSGYTLMRVILENGKSVGYETFAEGWLDHDTQKQFGRPVDVLQLKDGSLLVSDDYAGVVYRITYEG